MRRCPINSRAAHGAQSVCVCTKSAEEAFQMGTKCSVDLEAAFLEVNQSYRPTQSWDCNCHPLGGSVGTPGGTTQECCERTHAGRA